MNNHGTQGGFITIAAVLLLLTVSVAVALEALMTSWQSSDTQAAWVHNARARALAGACVERARSQFRMDTSYIGSESLSFEAGACSVLSIASGSFEVRAEGRSKDAVARLFVVFDLSVNGSGSVDAVDMLRYERVAQF